MDYIEIRDLASDTCDGIVGSVSSFELNESDSVVVSTNEGRVTMTLAVGDELLIRALNNPDDELERFLVSGFILSLVLIADSDSSQDD